MIMDFLDSISGGSEWCLAIYSADCLEGNSFSQTKLKSRAKWIASPSTNEVRRVTVAALRLPAGKLTPILSSFSRSILPPFFDLALLKIPPSNDAFKHSGGDKRRCTSPTVTLYFELELRRDKRPGTWQKTSAWLTKPPPGTDGKLRMFELRAAIWLCMLGCKLLVLLALLELLLQEPDEDIIEADITKFGSFISSMVLLLSGVVADLLMLLLSLWCPFEPDWW